VHRTIQRWVEPGILDLIWASLLKECEKLNGIDWEWQVAEGATGKARFGDLVGPNPTDRAKTGVKRSLLAEANGGSLAVCQERTCATTSRLKPHWMRQ
jgi:putative transposase